MKFAIAAALLVLAAGCGGGSERPKTGEPESFRLAGSLTVVEGSSLDGTDFACEGGLGYDDIGPGASIVVRNSDGKTVGLGSLSAGVLLPDGTKHAGGCRFGFSIESIVASADSDFYSIQFAERGETEFPRDKAGDLDLVIDD